MDIADGAIREGNVVATPAALVLIARLQAQYGPLMFHLSGGCCDGSAPLCFQHGEFLVGDNDILVGTIGDSPFYMYADQYARWHQPQIIVDAGPGAAEGFSLEGLLDMHFLTRAPVFLACEPP
jgi:uncharacterized protein (DUF779 family)